MLMLDWLAACGTETTGTAALKKQELDQPRATLDKVRRDLDNLAKQAAQRTVRAEESN